MPRIDRLTAVMGAGVFGFMLVLAWRYYLERTAIADSAFMSFWMLDAQHPVSFLGRYGSWLPQLIPMAMQHLGASLEAVLRTYSLMLVMVHVVVFCIIAFRLKDRVVAIAHLIALCASYHYMFYYGISELYQGLSITMLTWACLRKWFDAPLDERRPWRVVIMLVLTIWASIYHQLLVGPAVFLLVYEVIERRLLRDRRTWFAFAAVVVIYAARILLLSSSEYEQDRIPSAHDFSESLSRFWELGSTKYFVEHWTMYKAILVLLVTQLVIAVASRKWLALLWSWGTAIVFLVFVLITDRDGGSPRIYENYIPLLGLFLGVDLAHAAGSMLVSEGSRRISLVLVNVVLLLGCLLTFRGHYMPSAHIRWAQRITGQLIDRGEQKAVIHFNSFPWSYAWGTGLAAFETALSSGVHGPRNAATVFVSNEKEMPLPADNKRYVFLGPEWSPNWFTTNHFHRKHFKFKPGWYRHVTTQATDLEMVKRVAGQVAMRPLDTVIHMVADRFTVVEVELKNAGTDTLHAILPNGEPLRLAYRVYTPDGVRYGLFDERTAMEMDLLPGGTLITGMAIERPNTPGLYDVEIGLPTDTAWWHGKAHMKMKVGRFGF